MFDRLLQMSRVLNKPGFSIRHGCICKGYAESWILTGFTSNYGAICLSNAWICLNMHYFLSVCLNMAEYCWMSLNMPENGWINCSDYARVLNMSQSSNNITNVINLAPLYIQAPWYHFIFFVTRVGAYKNNKN